VLFIIGGCSKSEEDNAPSSQPAETAVKETSPASMPDVEGALEQAKEYGEEVVKEAVDSAKEMASEEIEKKVDEAKEKVIEKADDILPDDPETDAVKDMLMEKAESEGVKIPTLP